MAKIDKYFDLGGGRKKEEKKEFNEHKCNNRAINYRDTSYGPKESTKKPEGA